MGVKRWATATELIEMFPERFKGYNRAYVQGTTYNAVKAGRIKRELRPTMIANGPRRTLSPALVWHYYTPDVRVWLRDNSRPARRNPNVRVSSTRLATAS